MPSTDAVKKGKRTDRPTDRPTDRGRPFFCLSLFFFHLVFAFSSRSFSVSVAPLYGPAPTFDAVPTNFSRELGPAPGRRCRMTARSGRTRSCFFSLGADLGPVAGTLLCRPCHVMARPQPFEAKNDQRPTLVHPFHSAIHHRCRTRSDRSDQFLFVIPTYSLTQKQKTLSLVCTGFREIELTNGTQSLTAFSFLYCAHP